MRILLVVVALSTIASAAEKPEPPKPVSHTIRQIEGWTVRVDDRLLAPPDDALGAAALRFLEGKLSDLRAVVAPDRLAQLQAVAIVLDRTHGKLRAMQYHPSAGWLEAHGYSTNLAKCVHIPEAADLLTTRNINEQPWVVLHELAHAYHDQVLGFDEPRIRQAYERFRECGHGDAALLYNGQRVRHYGLTDPKEFFAEMTEAYFGENDFFPFNRAELMTAEPGVFELMKTVWGPLQTGRFATRPVPDATFREASAPDNSVAAGKATSLTGGDRRVRPPYTIVDTGQDRCFNHQTEIPCPDPGAPFRGQDAQYRGLQPAYRDNGDGTVTDLHTGLMWQKRFDLGRKQTFAEAKAGAARCRTGGFADWRLPTIKELYSLIDFSGGMGHRPAKPYLDTNYFDFVYGDPDRGERRIDAQYWSATEYVGRTMRGNATVFGVNFADGRIKGYPRDRSPRGPMLEFVRYVRGASQYGTNEFLDHGDGSITDRATGLIWAKADSGRALNWEQALAYAENLTLAGHDDWRLPNAKELQSIVDYTRAPDATNPAARGPAIDPVFTITDPESYFWTGTTHLEGRPGMTGEAAVYVCFGRGMGYLAPPGTREPQRLNVHGAGAQRSDPKAGDPQRFPYGRGPQGDDIRIFNYARAVRGGDTRLVE